MDGVNCVEGWLEFTLNVLLFFVVDFHLVVCGLDSIVARRWINGMLVGVVVFLWMWYVTVQSSVQKGFLHALLP